MNGLYLKSIKTYHFRNLTEQVINFSPNINFITGKNGQGKSNLLEAIYLLSTTRSFRTSKTNDLTNNQFDSSSVHGAIVNNEADINIGIEVNKGKKKVYLNGEPTEQVTDYLTSFPVVAFTPQMVEIVFGEPSARRNFLDRYTTLYMPNLLSSYSAYNKLIRTKSFLLKDRTQDLSQILSINQLISKHACNIINGRNKFISAITPYLSDSYLRFAENDGQIAINCKNSFSQFNNQLDLNEENYYNALDSILAEEKRKKRTLLGPHLDDFTFVIGAKLARSFASQGQARSIILAMLVAAVRVIEGALLKPPALLLDDLSSELDSERMRLFFKLLEGENRQVFVTGTELPSEVTKASSNNKYTVIAGQIFANSD